MMMVSGLIVEGEGWVGLDAKAIGWGWIRMLEKWVVDGIYKVLRKENFARDTN